MRLREGNEEEISKHEQKKRGKRTEIPERVDDFNKNRAVGG